MHTITIGIITYRRPESLAVTLRSLRTLVLPAGCTVKLLVVDNDKEGSARETVQSASLPFAVEYALEERRGIPYARNKVLSMAEGSNYVAFIDDDDTADNNWLLELYQAAQRYEAEVVKGRVVYTFPQDKSYLSVLDIYADSPHKTGDTLDSAWTNNVLFSTKISSDWGLRFDAAFNESGGSDHHFFSAAHSKGARIVMCREAIIRCSVPEARTSFGWLAKRHARIGATLSMSEIKRYGKKSATQRARVACGDSLRYCKRLLPAGKQDRRLYIHPVMVLCFMGGRMLGLMNLSPREYS